MIEYRLLFKNKILFLISFFLIVNLLNGCGGGGTATSNAAASLSGGPVSITTLKNYQSGAGIITASGVVAGQTDSNYTAGHRDISSVQTVLTGTTNLVVLSASESGNNYTALRAGTSSTNKYIVVSSEGTYLNYSGTEYVSASSVNIDGILGVISAGTKPHGLPAGSYNYQGTSIIVRNTSIPDTEKGTFSMTADFSNQTASIAANTANYVFNDNNIILNNSDGSFSGTSGNIGLIGGATENANIKGFFAGTNASGTHGLSYSSGNQANYAGVFYGTR